MSDKKPINPIKPGRYSTINMFALNLVLMLVWAALTVGFSLLNLLFGFLLAWLVLFFTRPVHRQTVYSKKPFLLVKFITVFVYRLFASSVRVVWEILTIEYISRPGIIEIPLDVKTDTQLLLLTNYISLTPGSLTLDVCTEKNVLYVHAMFVSDPDKLREDIKQGIEQPILEISS